MKQFLFFTQLLAAACLAAPNAITDKLYTETDLNKDGRVTSKEFADHIIGVSFVVIDVNQDHRLDAQEWAKTEKGAAGKKSFAALDKNKDGAIDFEEYSSDSKAREILVRIFLTVDPNDDGVLTKQEVPANQKP